MRLGGHFRLTRVFLSGGGACTAAAMSGDTDSVPHEENGRPPVQAQGQDAIEKLVSLLCVRAIV